jgi:hypothetical protein
LIFLIVFVILSAILAYSSTVPLSQSEASSLSQGVEGIKGTTIGIFENNVKIALLEFVPGFGPAFGVYASYSTGLAISALAQSSPKSGISGIELFLILLLTPIYWLEFTCYSMAVEESIALIASVKNNIFRLSEWKWLIGSVVFVIATLFVSAQLEVQLINFMK